MTDGLQKPVQMLAPNFLMAQGISDIRHQLETRSSFPLKGNPHSSQQRLHIPSCLEGSWFLSRSCFESAELVSNDLFHMLLHMSLSSHYTISHADALLTFAFNGPTTVKVP